MALTRRPITARAGTPRGGGERTALPPVGSQVRSEQPKRAEKPIPVLVRMSPDLLRHIDRAVRSRRIKIPRQTWILEAIVEQLEREGAAA